MKTRRFHRLMGLIMLLPLICWAITGTIFFIKPGYQSAYESLSVKTYPLDKSFSIPANENWQEVRLIKTILGYHLLIKTNGDSVHLNATTLKPWESPSGEQLHVLIGDAIAQNKTRYGEIDELVDNEALTNTNVRVSLDWKTLRLRQKGDDTDLINLLYKVHYLQWTPWDFINQILGIVGLVFLVVLSLLGVRLYVRSRKLR